MHKTFVTIALVVCVALAVQGKPRKVLQLWDKNIDGTEPGNARRIAVYDNVVSLKKTRAWMEQYKEEGVWRLQSDYADAWRRLNESIDETDAIEWGFPFTYEMPLEQFHEEIWPDVEAAARRYQGDGPELLPYACRLHVVRRGDLTLNYASAESSDDDEVNMMVYLNSKWKRNHYGESLFFDRDDEVAASVHPVPGRAILWDASISMLPRPPSMAQKRFQIIVFVRLTRSPTAFAIHREQRELSLKRDESAKHTASQSGRFALLPPYDSVDSATFDVAPLIHSQVKDRNGRRLQVIDNLFTPEEIETLHSYLKRFSPWNYDEPSDPDEETDNVQFIAQYPIGEFTATSMWYKILKLINHLTPDSAQSWYPYDVACNLIRMTDDTRIHEDGNRNEDEWTFLLYLTPNWTANDYGETAFYNRPIECDTPEAVDSDDSCAALQNYELIAQVHPLFSRSTIFQGAIPHSARPPSPSYIGSRYSFVAKLSVSRDVASLKGPEGSPLRDQFFMGCGPCVRQNACVTRECIEKNCAAECEAQLNGNERDEL